MRKCCICVKNPADAGFIKWTVREGNMCNSCEEKCWDCPECNRRFYLGENNGFKPRHNISPKSGSKPCHGWKSKKRIDAERYYGLI